MVPKEDLCKMLNAAIEEELTTVFTYDEMLEVMPEEHVKHRDMIVKIMKEEAKHAICFRRIALEMGCSEPEVWQKIEKMLGVMEQKYPGTKT